MLFTSVIGNRAYQDHCTPNGSMGGNKAVQARIEASKQAQTNHKELERRKASSHIDSNKGNRAQNIKFQMSKGIPQICNISKVVCDKNAQFSP